MRRKRKITITREQMDRRMEERTNEQPDATERTDERKTGYSKLKEKYTIEKPVNKLGPKNLIRPNKQYKIKERWGGWTKDHVHLGGPDDSRTHAS